jgi:hypothetical protein
MTLINVTDICGSKISFVEIVPDVAAASLT